MSLTDKVIKNTYYHFLSQIINFLAPLFLTPFIIAHIGNTEFGIYAFIIGVAGIFGLLDLSISTSFFKFISEYYNQKKYAELNSVVSTAMVFYFVFSLLCITIAVLLKGYFLSAINIPPELEAKAEFTYYTGLAAFSAVNIFGIYNSVIISLQKMYITSLYNIILSALNFISVVVSLLLGFGLYGILSTHIFFICCSLTIGMYYSFRLVPELKISLKYFKWKTLRDMFNIGSQMQVSKLASFASDKYDEFLLAYFSVIGNVTFYNISARVARVGKIIPTQLFTQAAPVAAELNAKQNTSRLEELFEDTTKYLTFVSVPLFSFMFIFAEELIFAWVGPGYGISAHLLRIIGIGSLINLLLSAPGNSITPNIGKPKFSMYEGLIYLSINLVLSYIFVKNYGIIGAAYGSTISTAIAAIYVYFVSVRFFNRSWFAIASNNFIKPVISTLIASAAAFTVYFFSKGFYSGNQVTTGAALALLFLIFGAVYILPILVTKYFTQKEFLILAKIILFFPPVKKYILKRNRVKAEDINEAKMSENASLPNENQPQKAKSFFTNYRYYYYRFISLLETEAHRQSGGKIF